MADFDIERTKYFEFERSILRKYMVYSFQYVDPYLGNYKSKESFILFHIGRVLVILLIWLIIGFGFFYTIETRNSHDVNALTHQHFILIGRTVANLWQIFNFHIGLYLFYKYPTKIQNEIQEFKEISGSETQEKRQEVQQKLRECGKHMRKFLIVSFSVFVMLRFLTNLIYLSVDGKISLRVIMLVGVALHRMFSLPFLLYFVFLARLQVMKVEAFTKSLASKNLDVEKQVVIERYNAISSSIKRTAKEYHIYVTFLVVFLCVFVLRFANVIAGDIDLIGGHSKITPLEILYHVKETIESATDITIYVIVLINLSRVSLAQKNVLSKLLNLENYDVRSSDVRLDTVNILEKHHHLHGTGYNVFGIAITGMKALLFAAFMSLSGFIARMLLTT